MILSTDRLLLRDFVHGDWQNVDAFHTDPEVRRYLLWHQRQQTSSRRFVIASIASAGREPRTFYGLAIVLKDGGQIIGFCTLQWSPGRRAVGHVGWELDRRYWNRGYATEAACALLGLAFDGIGLVRVEASCFTANIPSVRVMEKVGMKRVPGGGLAEWFARWGTEGLRPMTRFALTRRQWAAQASGRGVV